MTEHEIALTNFLQTKKGKVIYFSVRDIHINPKGYHSSKIITSARKRLAQWLYVSLKGGRVTVSGFDIVVFSNGTPFKYIATKN